jgi:iron(III) transport system ATP-binding protein
VEFGGCMSEPLKIENVTKKYGNFKAIENVSLTINPGEFFTLLGPSGCGKTTLLRMIAGFNSIEDGVIKFTDTIINAIPAYQRNIGMVFQNYAIFPHLTVFDNVAYGLKARKLPKEEIEKQVVEVLELVKMIDYRDRKPQNLSGGQQQRIALARAIVIKPAVLLMDEPLSNLDAKLRVEMRMVIKKIQNKLGITTIYVTHDQEEALSISDRIAVINKGEIQQVGSPHEIYTHPVNTFVANFIGTSSFIDCTVQEQEPLIFGKYPLGKKIKSDYSGKCILSVRPEEVVLVPTSESEFQGKISFFTFLGDFINYEIDLENEQTIQVNEYLKDCDTLRKVGDTVGIHISQKKVTLFNPSGKGALL